MENPRLFLIIAIAFVGLLLFQSYQRDVAEKIAREKGQTGKVAKTNNNDSPSLSSSPTKPGKQVATNKPNKVDNQDSPELKQDPDGPMLRDPGNKPKVQSAQRIKVKTDVLIVYLDTIGSDIREVNLLKYSVSIKDKTPRKIMTDRGANFYISETGFKMGANSSPGPGKFALFKSSATEYILGKDDKKIEVPFTWEKDGVKVTKTYVFKRGEYDIKLKVKVENNSDKDWIGSFWRVLNRADSTDLRKNTMLPTTVGATYYTETEGYNKISFSDIKDQGSRPYPALDKVKGGWVAMIEQFFVGAWIPEGKESNIFYTRYDSKEGHYKVGMQTYAELIKQKSSKVFTNTFYIGPKIQDKLEKLSDKLELTVDYGWLTFLSKPLFWLLDVIHSVVRNWGLAIILLTFMIKLVFYKLSETSYRSMAKMRKLSPRMASLKERHGDNRQAYHTAIQELFRKEKVNPLGGCLPILVQIPVFIALYYVLLESVELRQAPFIFWIQDLSEKDPFFILPLLMGATMFIQHKLNPPQLDPIQQKVMMALPIIFTVFFMIFPAGLVLYWLVNNILSILQQYVITKRITGETNLLHGG